MANTIPEYVDLDVSAIKLNARPSYKPAPNFDFEKGDFARDALGRVPYADGHETWKQWCIKVAMTERDTCIAYSTNIGTEMNDAGSEGTRKAVESALQRTITEALMVHPMTEAVRRFEFRDTPDGGVYCGFDIIGRYSAAFTIGMSFKV